MNQTLFKIIIFLFINCFIIQNLIGAEKDSTSSHHPLVPNHVKVQFAGGIGIMSVSGGWDYGKKNTWETDIFLGYLPKFEGENANLILTANQLFSPFLIELNSFSIEPLTTSLGVSYLFGKEFNSFTGFKEQNPGYYGFPTSVNFLFSVGQRIKFNTPKSSLTDNITLYNNINTNIYYISSIALNSELKITDILNISLGIKIGLKTDSKSTKR